MLLSMNMRTGSDRGQKIEIERRLLAALCQHTLDPRTRQEVLERLAQHTFVSPEHEVIFRVVSRIAQAAPGQIKEAVKTRVTRLGFPDIDVDPLFTAGAPSPEQARALLKQL
jgi:hypothetical protein